MGENPVRKHNLVRSSFAIVRNLSCEHGVVKSTLSHQFLVSAIFYGSSFVHDGDAVGIGDGRQFVRDDDDSRPFLFAHSPYILKDE